MTSIIIILSARAWRGPIVLYETYGAQCVEENYIACHRYLYGDYLVNGGYCTLLLYSAGLFSTGYPMLQSFPRHASLWRLKRQFRQFRHGTFVLASSGRSRGKADAKPMMIAGNGRRIIEGAYLHLHRLTNSCEPGTYLGAISLICSYH